MLTPLLTEADPKVSAEGSIDPLGMYAIADRLAVRLVPGVRERQAHPRFLTSIAVSLSLCGEFDEDVVAADRVSEPWQVFEWYLVEGLVRTTKDSKLLRGLPGREKAATAITDRVPLSAKRYLKTPTIFGFHGIYRGLARDTEVEHAGRLGDVGYQLLSVWEQEQGLQGFSGTRDGRGRAVRGQLLDAIEDGLVSGAVARKAGWAGWRVFSEHLGIYEAGEREAQVIWQALLNPSSGFRRDVSSSLISPRGRRLWKKERETRSLSERRFHELLMSRDSAELQELLRAIDAYERFCRLLQDAFGDCIERLSRYQQRIPLSELSGLAGVKRAAKQVPELFTEVTERLAPFHEAARFQDAFSSLAERLLPADWAARLLDHHGRIQYSKPPAGKAPWFDRFDDGSCMIRTGYVQKSGGRHDDAYVHRYRTSSLWSFAQDVGKVT